AGGRLLPQLPRCGSFGKVYEARGPAGCVPFAAYAVNGRQRNSRRTASRPPPPGCCVADLPRGPPGSLASLPARLTRPGHAGGGSQLGGPPAGRSVVSFAHSIERAAPEQPNEGSGETEACPRPHGRPRLGAARAIGRARPLGLCIARPAWKGGQVGVCSGFVSVARPCGSEWRGARVSRVMFARCRILSSPLG
ncbi:unnamed protein product, partial [Amoebophrya sp. A120]